MVDNGGSSIFPMTISVMDGRNGIAHFLMDD